MAVVSKERKRSSYFCSCWRGKIIVGNTLKSTLSADHRVLDGAVAGKLLRDFNDIIEDPFEIWIKSSDMEIL